MIATARVSLVLFALSASGCAWFGDGRPNYGKTLADIPVSKIPDDPLPVPETTLEQIEDSYRGALAVAEDPGIRHQILVRLADLEMKRSEQQQLDAETQEEYFASAVKMYEELIMLNRQRPVDGKQMSSERLLYQLSKAYALDGRMAESDAVLNDLVQNYPESGFAAEADFRRAEQAFSNGDYTSAEALYAQVVAAGEGTPFYDNAIYMHGWSQFKRGRNRASVKSFTTVLDRMMVIEGEGLTQLSNSDRNLVNDTLRVMGIVFSYLDGAESITKIYQNLGQRHYQHLLYMELGNLYLEKKRYRDSADTFRHYVREFPQTDYSPEFSVKAIEVYSIGNFPSEILPAKEEYVRNYGVYSNYWKVREDEKRSHLKPQLHAYLEELSTYYHARAQQNAQIRQEHAELRASGKKPDFKLPRETPEQNYMRAATYYEQFIATFPDDPKTGEMTYLMAEAYYEAGQLEPAIGAYEAVAYTILDQKHGGEAGYSALIALQELIEQLPRQTQAEQQKLAELRAHKVNSSITFADYYPNDPRAVPVLTKAAEDIFQQGDLPRAVTTATRITQWQPAPPRSLQKTAWLVIAHSQFDLAEYDLADTAYRQVLAILPPEAPDRPEIIERIAASMYRSAETQLQGGQKAAAVARLLSISQIAPASDIAVTAQYDAATYLMELENWREAERVLLDFKQRYPQHELTATLTPKMALIYQETEQWDRAADELAKMANSGDPEVRRQSLYLSAELYEKSGKLSRAINQYREYANTYPSPFPIVTEARYKLVELYGKSRDLSKRNYWLRKLIEEDARAGSQRTERSKYLAAMATSEFAQDDFNRFTKTKLTLPLKNSMRKKKSAMDQCLKSYRKVLAYGVAEFSTDANYKIGELYGQLSQDLMNSQRPKGLDDLALEQYEILLEEQAFPFEEKAIDIHAGNIERAWEGIYDKGVKSSFEALAKLLPARYGKKETRIEVSDGLH